MTQPITSRSDTEDDATLQPADVLIGALVALLAPMFLLGADGRPGLAEMAALETIRSYSVRNHASLIKIANIIAFGLATLGSLSLSMQDDFPITLVLQLRSNANALDRSAARNERAVDAGHPVAPAPEPRRGFAEAAAVHADVSEASRQAAEVRASAQAPKPAVHPAAAPAAAPAAPKPAPEPVRSGKIWGGALANAAAEDLAKAVQLPPARRKEMTAKAAILSSTANSLLTGAPLDFARMNRPGTPSGPAATARR